MDRLTKRLHGSACYNECNGPCSSCDGSCGMHHSMVSRLADYEDTGYSPEDFDRLCREMSDIRMALGIATYEQLRDMVENGRLRVLPCKMGDMVWGIARHHKARPYVKQGVVYQMFFVEDMRLCICVKGVCRGEWGKNVFATKEDAEKALAEMMVAKDNP